MPRLVSIAVALLLCARAAAAQPGAAPPRDIAAAARLTSPDPAVRAAAADELAADHSRRAEELLVWQLLNDPVPEVRIAAAHALDRRGDPTLIGALERSAAADGSPEVRAAAEDARAHLWPLGKSPRRAGAFSLLCPGCGHFYLGDTTQGLLYLASTAALVGGAVGLLVDNDSADPLDPDAEDRDPEDPLALPLIAAAQNLWFYAAFDAYRDARRLRGDRGYQHRITDESLPHLASAPFRPSVLARPWVWAVVPVAFGLGMGLTYAVDRDSFEGVPSIFEVDRVRFLGGEFSPGTGYALGGAYYASVFTSVAVGEEALFRGFLQSELTEAYGPWTGWAIASAVFGAVHVFNFYQPGADPSDALIAVPFITAVGSTLGLAYMKNDYRLETGVAMHFWYDFLLSAAGFAIDPENQPFAVHVTMPF
jgi:membrane protease YdiL (CAAX protease family)